MCEPPAIGSLTPSKKMVLKPKAAGILEGFYLGW